MPNSDMRRVRIRIGSLEAEGEGPEDFVLERFPALIERVLDIAGGSVSHPNSPPPGGDAEENRDSAETPLLPKMGTSTIAQKLKVSSGSDLIVAAAARLTLVDGKETFSRRELLEAMKAAKAYYKKTYSNNLSSYLTRLVRDGELLEPGGNDYTLSAGTRERLESTLGS